ncbi:MAG TPA: response regulator [Verrucomicrobia bacterium]|nr:response regulator [Verrucomicrobiota bacterium]
MKTLIVEDEITGRMILQDILGAYGLVHAVVNGIEAVESVKQALADDDPYDLICMDIMMPEMDGQQALQDIRDYEDEAGVGLGQGAKVIMVTALGDVKNVCTAYNRLCDGYLVKPVDASALRQELLNLKLIH